MESKELKITKPMDFGVTTERAEAAMAKLNALLGDPERTSGMLILGGRDLSDDEITPLVLNETLFKIYDRWYYVADPDLPPAYREPDAWNAVYWDFVREFLNDRYGDNWCLDPVQPCLRPGVYDVPPQFLRICGELVRGKGARIKDFLLPWYCEILVIEEKLPEGVQCEPCHGLRVTPEYLAALETSQGA